MSINTTSSLDGLFKNVYGSGPVNVVSDVAYLQKRIPFKETERIGKQYAFPVVLTQEAGVTYLASGSGSSTLESSIAAVLKEAQVDAHQIIVRGQMDYEAAAKAQGSKAAFKSASDLLVENLMDTASKRLEIAFLYGRSATGLGVGDTSANSSATVTVVTMTAASWSPGIWSGLENATLNAYKSSDDSLISSGADAVFTLTAVDFVNKKLTLTGTATGISALDTHLAAPGDCYFHFKNAKSAEPIGIDKICLNTGTLFNISASSYAMWSGNSFSAGSAALTTAKILNALKLSVGKGGLLEEVDVIMSPATFLNISGTMTDLRKLDGPSKDGVAGFESIKIYGPNGICNIVSHPMVKEGEAFIVPFKDFKRVGSQDFSFETPGRKGEMFLHVTDTNAYELRLYGAQQIVCSKPAKITKITSIVNS